MFAWFIEIHKIYVSVSVLLVIVGIDYIRLSGYHLIGMIQVIVRDTGMKRTYFSRNIRVLTSEKLNDDGIHTNVLTCNTDFIQGIQKWAVGWEKNDIGRDTFFNN